MTLLVVNKSTLQFFLKVTTPANMSLAFFHITTRSLNFKNVTVACSLDKSPVGSFLEEYTFSVRVHSLSQEYERRDISCCVSLSSQIRCHKSKACIIKRGLIGGAPSWMIVWLNFDSGIIFENSQCWKNLHYKWIHNAAQICFISLHIFCESRLRGRCEFYISLFF